MKRLVVLFIVVALALLLAVLGGLVWSNIYDGFLAVQAGQYQSEEVIPLVIESSCVDDLQQYEDEVEARINAAVLLERARHQAAQDDMQRIINEAVLEERGKWVSQIEAAIGTMKIYEDGVWETPEGEFGCIPYSLCDADNEMLWNPQDLFWPPE
jgi:hypothetical protein